MALKLETLGQNMKHKNARGSVKRQRGGQFSEVVMQEEHLLFLKILTFLKLEMKIRWDSSPMECALPGMKRWQLSTAWWREVWLEWQKKLLFSSKNWEDTDAISSNYSIWSCEVQLYSCKKGGNLWNLLNQLYE